MSNCFTQYVSAIREDYNNILWMHRDLYYEFIFAKETSSVWINRSSYRWRRVLLALSAKTSREIIVSFPRMVVKLYYGAYNDNRTRFIRLRVVKLRLEWVYRILGNCKRHVLTSTSRGQAPFDPPSPPPRDIYICQWGSEP